jgi:hypothetical protein
VPDHAYIKRMQEIMRKLDEVTQAAQELRTRVQREMEAAHERDAAAGDDPDVTRARNDASRRR